MEFGKGSWVELRNPDWRPLKPRIWWWPMLTRSQVMDLLRPLKGELAARYRVRELALFGSLVRQEQGPSSDVDLLVDFAEGATLFDLVGLGLFLEEKLGCPVEVGPRRALRREMRDEALNQAVPV